MPYRLQLPQQGIGKDNKGMSEKCLWRPGGSVLHPMAQRRSPVEAHRLEIGPKLASLTFGLKAAPANTFKREDTLLLLTSGKGQVSLQAAECESPVCLQVWKTAPPE